MSEKKYEILNLTMHDVTIKFNGETHVIPKSGLSVRCKIPMEKAEDINGIPCEYKRTDMLSTLLPPEQEGVLLLVSSMVLDACPDRKDLIAPNTSKGMAIKNNAGKTIAVKGLQRIK